jgi:hypothetical protein
LLPLDASKTAQKATVNLAGHILGLCRGFMIEGVSKEDMSGYDMTLAGGTVRYDAAMIQAIGHTIGPYVFIPFNAAARFEQNDNLHFAGSIDFESDRIKDMPKSLEISFHNPVAAITAKVYAVCINRMMTKSGMGAILYNILQPDQHLEPTTLIHVYENDEGKKHD